MRRVRFLQVAALISLAELGSGVGCIHNHYYGYPQSACVEAPGGAGVVVGSTGASPSGAVAYGSVCEVAPPATAVATGPGRRVVSASPRPSRVIVSEPAGEVYSSRGGIRSAWRGTSPETMTATRVEGAIDSNTVTR